MFQLQLTSSGRYSLVVFLTAFALSASLATAEVKVPSIFGDHMVLQQDGKIPVWGTADPGESVKVTVGANAATTQADPQGNWRVDLPPLPTNTTATTMTIVGKNTLAFQDVLVGEVWLASGQSNMTYNLAWAINGKDVVAQCANPQIRIYVASNWPAIRPKTQGGGNWQLCTPESAAGSSAVAYFFGQQLQQSLHRPIGLIEASWGGTSILSWTSYESLKPFPEFAGGLDQVQKEAAAFPADAAGQAKAMADFEAKEQQWVKDFDIPFHATYEKWQKDRDAAKAANQPIPPEPSPPNNRPTSPDGNEGEFTTLFNGMINPLIPYGMKGVIWYQGEANANRGYGKLLQALISDWRGRWTEGDFPFLVVGLANIGDRVDFPSDNGWAEIRGEQATVAQAMPNVGLAEAIDVGTAHNIHPMDKLDVGKRLAAQALHIAYGQNNVSAGPRFDSMIVEGNKIRIKYKDIGSGMALAVSPFVANDPPNENPALPTTDPLGFDIAGADKKWVVAQAKIEGNDVLVWSDQVPSPVAVRYAWAQNPKVNLYNKEGFPAVPFRTSDWPAAPHG